MSSQKAPKGGRRKAKAQKHYGASRSTPRSGEPQRNQTRFVTVEGDRMHVRNTPMLRAGAMVNIQSVWERLK